jgi:hypothetical protein
MRVFGEEKNMHTKVLEGFLFLMQLECTELRKSFSKFLLSLLEKWIWKWEFLHLSIESSE